MHRTISPKILYFGTPVVLISTTNDDGSANLAPMSSAWWLDQSCMLGMSDRSQTVANLLRTRECVLNLPSADMVAAIDRLALTTGRFPVPPYKEAMGYRYAHDKFAVAGLTAIPATLVAAPRVRECPVHLEAQLRTVHPFGEPDDHVLALELSIMRVHVEEALLVAGTTNHIDPDAWQPLIMNFTEFYGLTTRIASSRLAKVYRPAEATREQ